MTSHPIDPAAARRQQCLRPFVRAMRVSTLVWGATLAAALGCWIAARLSVSSPIQLGDLLVLAVASLLVSYASLVPALIACWAATAKPTEDLGGSEQSLLGQQQSGLMVFGVMIRLTGTVALFLTCRYHMATPTTWVAAMTIGWYALLTFVDITVLARELPAPFDTPTDIGTEKSLSRRRSEHPAPVQGFARDASFARD